MEHGHGASGVGSAQARPEVHPTLRTGEAAKQTPSASSTIRHYEAGAPGGDSIVAVPVIGLLMLLTWLLLWAA